MDIDYVNAVINGRHADVGAPPPLLDEATRARAVRRLIDLSPSGDAAPMLLKLGLRVVETALPVCAPMLTQRERILVTSSAPPAVRLLLVYAGLAVASLCFEATAPSSSDVWIVAGDLERIRKAGCPRHPAQM